MKVGYLTMSYDPETSSAAVPGVIARALRDRGDTVKVLTGYPNYPQGSIYDGYHQRLYGTEMRDGIVVGRTALWPSHDRRAYKRFLTYGSWAASASAVVGVLKDADAALVHLTPATNGAPALMLKARYGVPFVLHVQDLWPETVTATEFLSPRLSKVAESVLHPMLDHLYRRASHIACTSPGMVTAIARRGVPEHKLSVVTNWVDEAAFRPVPRDEELARELGLREFTVMYAGNLGHLQNLDVLLACAERLRDDHRIGFCLVGDGYHADGFRETVRTKGLDNVVFAGSQPFGEMSRYLALGDLHYVGLQDKPLFHTTLPSKLQVTMCVAKPILGAAAGDAAAVIETSGAGLAAHPDDVDALVTAIRHYADHPGDARAAGERGRAYYLENFSAETSSRKLHALLADAASARNRRKG